MAVVAQMRTLLTDRSLDLRLVVCDPRGFFGADAAPGGHLCPTCWMCAFAWTFWARRRPGRPSRNRPVSFGVAMGTGPGRPSAPRSLRQRESGHQPAPVADRRPTSLRGLPDQDGASPPTSPSSPHWATPRPFWAIFSTNPWPNCPRPANPRPARCSAPWSPAAGPKQRLGLADLARAAQVDRAEASPCWTAGGHSLVRQIVQARTPGRPTGLL